MNIIKYLCSSLLILSVGCSSDKDLSTSGEIISNISISAVKVEDNDNMVQLVSDLNPNVRNSINKVASSNNAISNSDSSSNSKYLIQEHNEFDFTSSLSAAIKTVKDVSALNSLNDENLKLSKEALDIRFSFYYNKFRLIIFRHGESSNPVYNHVLETGEKPNIVLNVNETYDWYAISNGEDVVPNIDGTGQIAKANITNKNLMYAKGSLKIGSGENYLQILFRKQTAKFSVNLNTRGIFGPIQDASSLTVGRVVEGVFSNLYQAGDFNIFTGKYLNLTEVVGLTSAEAEDKGAQWWPNEDKMFTFHTAINNDILINKTELAVRLNALSITLDNGNTRAFRDNTIIPIELNYTDNYNVSKGNWGSMVVRLIESPILVNGVKWARTNLVYDPSKLYNFSSLNANNSHRFRPDNNYSIGVLNEYWNFFTITPDALDVNKYLQCEKVFPEGTWKIPSDLNNSNHFTKLKAIPYSYEVNQLSDNTYRHSLVWPGEGAVNAAYPDNNLRFNMIGRRINGVIVDNPSSSLTAAGGLYLRVNAHSGTATDPPESFYTYTYYVEKGVNTNPGGLQYVRGYYAIHGYNVRCVRAN